MSLLCGNCHTDITRAFGVLYRLTIHDGQPCFPTKKRCPPNSALCDVCVSRLPIHRRLKDHPAAIDPTGRWVYAYQAADASIGAFGAKRWSDAEGKGRYKFVTVADVNLFFPRAVEIIDEEERILLERPARIARLAQQAQTNFSKFVKRAKQLRGAEMRKLGPGIFGVKAPKGTFELY